MRSPEMTRLKGVRNSTPINFGVLLEVQQMKQCPKCHSTNSSLLQHHVLLTFEDEYLYFCNHCGEEWVIIEDMNAEDARDMQNYLELRREERGNY